MNGSLLAAALLLAGCAAGGMPPLPPAPLQMKPLGMRTLKRDPSDPLLRHLGGVSGMDYDAARRQWVLLSDDRSDHAPARAYTAVIDVDGAGLHAAAITGVVPLLTGDGVVYPNARQGGEVPDPEALRIDPASGDWVWSSEGDPERRLGPSVRVSDRAGIFVREWALPANLGFAQAANAGPRPNLTIEGLAFAADGRSLWVAMEAPLLQDGPVPTTAAGGWARISHIDREGRVLGQYAYPLSPVPSAATGGRMRADNGISEIAMTDAGSLLVVERSGREVGDDLDFRYTARLYEATAAPATDVQRHASLQGRSWVPMGKRLVLDLSLAGLGAIDNIEAMAWGPRLPNGHRTLLLMSDDNFSPHQTTQVLAFEVWR
jgi:hypothetical protein